MVKIILALQLKLLYTIIKGDKLMSKLTATKTKAPKKPEHRLFFCKCTKCDNLYISIDKTTLTRDHHIQNAVIYQGAMYDTAKPCQCENMELADFDKKEQNMLNLLYNENSGDLGLLKNNKKE